MKWFLDLLKKVIALLLPREEHFFGLFLEMLEIVKRSIGQMQTVKSHNMEEIKKIIIANEADCDKVEYEVQKRLRASITTPPQLGRTKILEIACVIDNIMDLLKEVVRLLPAGNGEAIELLNQEFDVFWKILDKLYEASSLSINLMEDFSQNSLIYTDLRLKRIHDLENEIDDLHTDFKTNKLWYSCLPGKNLILQDIIERVENIGDLFQSLIKIIEGVLANG